MSFIKHLYKKITPETGIGFIIIYYFVGILGLLFPLTKPLFEKLVPLSLILNFLVLIFFHKPWNFRLILSFSTVYLLSLILEIAGVNSGQIFGHYLYGSKLGLSIFNTPLLIGINWFILTYSVYHLLLGRLKTLPLLLTGALILVIFDIILEPVAVHFSWWIWTFGYVPLQNYIAWYFTSLLLLFIIHLAGSQLKNKVAAWTLIIQLLFFVILNFIL